MKDLPSNFLNSQNYKSNVNLPIADSLVNQHQNPAANLRTAFQGFFNNPSENKNDSNNGYFEMSDTQTSPPLSDELAPFKISIGNKAVQRAPPQYSNGLLAPPKPCNEMNRHSSAHDLGQNKGTSTLSNANSLSRTDLNANTINSLPRGYSEIPESQKAKPVNNNLTSNSFGINPLMVVYQNTTPNQAPRSYDDTPMPEYKIELTELEPMLEPKKQPAQFSKAFSVPQYNSGKFNLDDEKFDELNHEPMRHTLTHPERRVQLSMPSIFEAHGEPKFSVPRTTNGEVSSTRNFSTANQLKNLFIEPSSRRTIANPNEAESHRNIQRTQLTASPEGLSKKMANNSPSYADNNYKNPISQTDQGESEKGTGDDDFTPDIFQKMKILEEEVTKLKALNDQKSLEIKALNRKIGNPYTELKVLMDERAQQEIQQLKEANCKLRTRVQDLESLAFRTNNDALSKKVNASNSDFVTRVIMLEHENKDLKEKYKNLKAIANNGTYQDLEIYLRKIQEMEAYIKDLKRKNERLEAQIHA